MEYVEVARAESERGEVVLRERHDPDEPTASPVLELRVNGVFVMDTARDVAPSGSSPRPRCATSSDQRAVRRRRPRPGLHRCTRCSPTTASSGSSWSRSRTRWCGGCGTAPIPHGPALLADERLHRRRRRHPDGDGARRPRRRTTWCCSTSTTAPATWSTTTTRRSTSETFLREVREGAAPRRCARGLVGRRVARPGRGHARGVRRRRRRSRYDVTPAAAGRRARRALLALPVPAADGTGRG